MQKTMVKACLFPALTGLLAGATAMAAAMLLGAAAAVKLEISISGYAVMVWLPVACGAFAAGLFAAAFAKEGKLLCGLAAAMLLWLVLLILLREYALSELVRGGVMLVSGMLGAMLPMRKRRNYKPGKAHARVRPRKGAF